MTYYDVLLIHFIYEIIIIDNKEYIFAILNFPLDTVKAYCCCCYVCY